MTIIHKTTIRLAMGLACFLLVGAVQAANFVGAAAQLGAIYNPGTMPIGIPALSVTNNDITGYHNIPNISYSSYFLGSGLGVLAGIYPDFNWVGDGGLVPATGSTWTFAAPASGYYLYAAIDHDPLPFEALESALWGSADGGQTWLPGRLEEVYELGFDAQGLPDDGSSRWSFPIPVSMISNTVGLSQGTYSYSDGDYETDAVMQIPEPATAVLCLVGLGALGLWRLRRK